MCVPITAATHLPACDRLEIRRINMQAAYLPNDHSEVAPVLDDTTKPQLAPRTLVPSSESEGSSLDQPSGQTPDSPVQTLTSSTSPKYVSAPAHEVTERQFIRITDVDTDEGSTPFTSGDERSVTAESLGSQPVDETRTVGEGSYHVGVQALGIGEYERGGGGGGGGGGEIVGVTDGKEHTQYSAQPLHHQIERYIDVMLSVTYVHTVYMQSQVVKGTKLPSLRFKPIIARDLVSTKLVCTST